MKSSIIIKGAREHNLKNIDVTIPHNALTVISGVSGSGKSSLAFDTIFSEGQRRYVESLSAYARQFLGRMHKPDFDNIEGLSPAISIEQKTTNRNPRSTVGTITEIYDYYRLLFARIGKVYDPKTKKEVQKQSTDNIISHILSFPENSRITILAPLIRQKKGNHKKILHDAYKNGYLRVRINGKIYELENEINLTKNKRHTIDLIIDRCIVNEEQRSRIAEAVEMGLDISDGTLYVTLIHTTQSNKTEEYFFSQQYTFSDENMKMPPLEPQIFSFNNPMGACPHCSGLGVTQEFSQNLIIPDMNLSFLEHGILPYNPNSKWFHSIFLSIATHYNFSLETPLNQLEPHIIDVLLYGSKNEQILFTYAQEKSGKLFTKLEPYNGIFADLERRYHETKSDTMQSWLEQFMSQQCCHHCKGKRLRYESLCVYIPSYHNGHTIMSLSELSIEKALEFFNTIIWTEHEQEIACEIIKEIHNRLNFLQHVGLNYLTLNRNAATLSGGEAQRIRLATQIGSALTGVLYVLDEPSIGLHQRDNQQLINTLLHLKNLGNTVIVVEHDEQIMHHADYIIDIGPGAGIHGGYVVAAGNFKHIAAHKQSITGKYLSNRLSTPIPQTRRIGNGNYLKIIDAYEHNLKHITVRIPLGTFTAITGVSGSGKSTLMGDILVPAVHNALYKTNHTIGLHKTITGIENLDKIISIDQGPIGRTPRSNPSTYIGVFSAIRELFAMTPEAKARGYKPGRFSFNVKGGRCDECQGAGIKKIEMHFLPDVFINCEICKGMRFNQETLDIRYKDKNIYDILNMTVEEALNFFQAIPSVFSKLSALQQVGLGYINLGQSATTLSGGEAQRVKLAAELAKRNTGKTLYVLDEPTTGLHFADIAQLITIIHALVDKGNTIILIEHNLDIIAQADYIIDLGPEGGDKGGMFIAEGTPEQLSTHKQSYTAQFLHDVLQKI